MEPGVGLSGMGLTGPSGVPAVELVGQQLGAPGVVVHVLDECVLDGHSPACGRK